MICLLENGIDVVYQQYTLHILQGTTKIQVFIAKMPQPCFIFCLAEKQDWLELSKYNGNILFIVMLTLAIKPNLSSRMQQTQSLIEISYPFSWSSLKFNELDFRYGTNKTLEMNTMHIFFGVDFHVSFARNHNLRIFAKCYDVVEWFIQI